MCERMTWVLPLEAIDATQVAVVGGKGAHLGELTRISGLRVPAGFCVTTEAFVRILAEAPTLKDRLERLAHLTADDREAIGRLCAEIRETIEGIAFPDDVATAILSGLARLGDDTACAVRSSATAEDTPTASFAGQHDSYLNVMGPAAILEHVRRCQASLFTERAVIYRLRHGLDHDKVHMAVIVQQMVAAQAAGVLFTADPVSGNRKVACIEAASGLGEAMVAGRVNPEVLLTDAQRARLVGLGRRIEAHFGRPQDLEWCLVDDAFWFVQSRPITTLFPIPAAADGENHVYVSVGHGQMMTDPMRPLGLSIWQLTAMRPMYEAGGRLFVDVTAGLASPVSRGGLLAMLGKGDPLVRDALQTLLDRGDFVPSPPDTGPAGPPPGPLPGAPPPIDTDPAIVTGLIGRTEASLAALKRDLHAKSGSALLDFLLADLQELKRLLSDPQNQRVIMAGMEATWWLNDQLQVWLGDTNAADALTQSVPNNVTAEMGLALLDVADAIRPHPDVVAFLQRVEDDDFLDALGAVAGGPEARDAIHAWLDRYGMRCVGEIDLTRPARALGASRRG